MPAVALGAIAIGAAGAVGSAVLKKKAADRAAGIQKDAISQQQSLLKKRLDPAVLNKLAQDADSERAKNRLALQKEIDPELAELRKLGKEQLLAQANLPEETRQSTQLANQLFQETRQQDPRLEALKNSILDAAQSELSAGATLPPEFQAELVRSGLNQGSQAGLALNRDTIGGGVARALGLAGIQLQQQRQQAAQQLANTGQNLVTARTNVLASIFPKLRDLETTRRMEARQNFGIGEATLPESGLGGQDLVNIEIAKQKGLSDLLAKQAQVRAQQAQNQGQFMGSLLGAGTSALSSGLGMLGGGAAGGGGVANSILSYNLGNTAGNQAMTGF